MKEAKKKQYKMVYRTRATKRPATRATAPLKTLAEAAPTAISLATGAEVEFAVTEALVATVEEAGAPYEPPALLEGVSEATALLVETGASSVLLACGELAPPAAGGAEVCPPAGGCEATGGLAEPPLQPAGAATCSGVPPQTLLTRL